MTKKGWTQISLMDSTKEKLKNVSKDIQIEHPYITGNNKTIIYLIQFYRINSKYKHSGKVKESSPLSEDKE